MLYWADSSVQTVMAYLATQIGNVFPCERGLGRIHLRQKAGHRLFPNRRPACDSHFYCLCPLHETLPFGRLGQVWRKDTQRIEGM